VEEEEEEGIRVEKFQEIFPRATRRVSPGVAVSAWVTYVIFVTLMLCREKCHFN